MELDDVLVIALVLFNLLLSIHRIRQRNLQTKSEGEPFLKEHVQLQSKSKQGWLNKWITEVLYLHFQVLDRDAVVTCKVSQNVWDQFQKGDQGLLSHQGGIFVSFTRDFDGKIIT